jgi:hypothetical protein
MLVGGLLLTMPAQASDTYMWGLGAKVGTTVLPAGYPSFWPPKVGDEDTFDPLRADISLGLQGLYYVTEQSRLGGMFGANLGSRFWDIHGLVTFDYLPYTGTVDFFVGGGLGVGQQTFLGRSEMTAVAAGDGELLIRPESLASLRIPNVPLRGHVGLMMRQRTFAVQGTVYGQYNAPFNNFYTDSDGFESKVGTGFYLVLGMELALFFGDFTPPRPQQKQKKNGQRK